MMGLSFYITFISYWGSMYLAYLEEAEHKLLYCDKFATGSLTNEFPY